jgi:hypothetical protein
VLRTFGVDTATGTTDWNFYYREFTPANNTQFFDIWLRSMSSSSEQCQTWYDDVGIIEWGDWQSIDSYANITNPNDYYWIQIRTNQQTSNATLSYQETDYNLYPAITENRFNPVYFKSFLTYPNPVKSLSTIQYNLLKSTKVVLKIYNSLGQEVRTLVNEVQTSGQKKLVWDGKDNQGKTIGSGIYFCHLQTPGYKQSRKIILLNK